jgi:hypothetical protein
MKKKDTRVLALVSKVMGDRRSRAEALESAATLSADEMREFVALLAADRRSGSDSMRSAHTERAAS